MGLSETRLAAATRSLLTSYAAIDKGRTGNPDESAHYITGLMIRDYIASCQFTSPMTYAENYYAPYPKPAFGMWPPFFLITEALWTLIFSPGKNGGHIPKAVFG